MLKNLIDYFTYYQWTFHTVQFISDRISETTSSNIWENGPWPKSWQRAAIWTHKISFDVMCNSGCLWHSCVNNSPAR